MINGHDRGEVKPEALVPRHLRSRTIILAETGAKGRTMSVDPPAGLSWTRRCCPRIR
jgi:hypothetical protein